VLSTVLLSLTPVVLAAAPAAASDAAPAAADRKERISVINPVGNDISYPQCTGSGWNGESYTSRGATVIPRNARFGIVGVNGGTAAKANPCLPAQLAWAAGLPGLANQPGLQLYVNTANPGAVLTDFEIVTWPSETSRENPYNAVPGESQSCTDAAGAGVNDLACSWEYGHGRAAWAADLVEEAAAVARVQVDLAETVVWLDVETGNTWQNGADGRARNAAALEGMTAYYQSEGAEVGLYSTAYQWEIIVGGNGRTGALAGLDSWLAGATSLDSAVSFCARSPLTPGGTVTLTQYVARQLDHDYSCADRP